MIDHVLIQSSKQPSVELKFRETRDFPSTHSSDWQDKDWAPALAPTPLHSALHHAKGGGTGLDFSGKTSRVAEI